MFKIKFRNKKKEIEELQKEAGWWKAMATAREYYHKETVEDLKDLYKQYFELKEKYEILLATVEKEES